MSHAEGPRERRMRCASHSCTSSSTQPTARLLMRMRAGKRRAASSWYTIERPRPVVLQTSGSLRPYVRQNTIECHIGDGDNDAAHADYWRVSDHGELFIVRGYVEDTMANERQRAYQPGAVFDLTLPVWRIGECLLFMERLASALGASDSTVTVRVEWTGLRGRKLASVSGRRLLHDNRVAQAERQVSQTTVQVASISPSLVEIVRELTLPLYALFDFFQPSVQLVSEELGRMQRREF